MPLTYTEVLLRRRVPDSLALEIMKIAFGHRLVRGRIPPRLWELGGSLESEQSRQLRGEWCKQVGHLGFAELGMHVPDPMLITMFAYRTGYHDMVVAMFESTMPQIGMATLAGRDLCGDVLPLVMEVVATWGAEYLRDALMGACYSGRESRVRAVLRHKFAFDLDDALRSVRPYRATTNDYSRIDGMLRDAHASES